MVKFVILTNTLLYLLYEFWICSDWCESWNLCLDEKQFVWVNNMMR